MNGHGISGRGWGWGEAPKKAHELLAFPLRLSGAVPICLGWRTRARRTQPREAPSTAAPAGRQEVAVVSHGSSSLQRFTDFTERGRSLS